MNIVLDNYTPLISYLSPASIPQIVAHIQDYLVKHPILSVETIAEIIVQSLQEHPELINGEAIPISADSEQSIKAYIDSLPSIDTYTKAEINALLLGKQDTLTFDQAPTPGSSNPVTSSGIIAALSALQTALETQIGLKADSASTYTKTQVDTLLEDKADAADVYSKNTMDAKLLEINTALINQSQQIDDLGPLNILTSDSTIAALSAAQGKVLNTAISDLNNRISHIYRFKLTSGTYASGSKIPIINNFGNDDKIFAENGSLKFAGHYIIFLSLNVFSKNTNNRSWIVIMNTNTPKQIIANGEYTNVSSTSLEEVLTTSNISIITNEPIQVNEGAGYDVSYVYITLLSIR